MEIAVISGKGGTGKSSISAAFATICQNVVLADCDVDAANLWLIFNPSHEEEEVYISGQKAVINDAICNKCGVCAAYCRFNAIAGDNGKIVISEILCDGCQLCARICPVNAIKMEYNDKSRMYSGTFRNGKMVYGRLAPGEENSGKLVSMVRKKAAEMAEMYGLTTIILDGPPGIGCPAISTITGVDCVVIVTEPTLSGMHDLQRTIEMVKRTETAIAIIINKFDLNSKVCRQIEDWCQKHHLLVAGKLPFDELVVRAMTEGKTITEWAPDHPFTENLREVWRKINHGMLQNIEKRHLNYP